MTFDTNTVIAFCAFLVGFAGLLSNSRKDAAKNESIQSEIRTSLDFIKEKLTSLDKKFDSLEEKEQETREIAIYARDRAEAAHSRLDRAGIDQQKQ